MHPPRRGKPFRGWTLSRSPFSSNLGNAPAGNSCRELALDCDQRAARDARWRHSARSASGSGLQLATRGSFPVAQHGGTIQSSSGLYIIAKGVSH